ncbi:MAG: hypothetical protein AYK19_00845 [Theionarchaea archaeon DG-70-1]|nr:MAG: hypothetical protein AYK19_00845 [Theionarchaea archaeon DG-70-1]
MYSQAKLQFEKAKKLYLEANMTEKVSEMQGMIAKCDKALDAETAYQKGMEYYSKKEYDNALTEFQRSKSLYDEIEDTKGSDKTQLMIDKCGGALKTLIAEAAYQEGMECYKHHEYDNAITKFEEAITLYEELENTEKAEELQNKLQEARDKNATKNRIFVIFGIFAAIVVVYLTVRMFVRRSKISGGSDILHLEKVYCSSCGKENIKGISYCRHCKAPLKSLDELEKEKILEDVSKKFISGEISEGEYHRIMNELKESL